MDQLVGLVVCYLHPFGTVLSLSDLKLFAGSKARYLLPLLIDQALKGFILCFLVVKSPVPQLGMDVP